MAETVRVRTLKPHTGEGQHRRRGEEYERDRGEANELRANGIAEIVDDGAKAETAAPQNKVEPPVQNKAEPVPQNKSKG